MKARIDQYLKRSIVIYILISLCIYMLGMSVSVIYASEDNFEEVILSLNSNVIDDTSISLYLYEDTHYITIDDLCALTRCSQYAEDDTISVTQGFWNAKFDIKNQVFYDGYQTVDIIILEVSENKYAVPALMFLSYYKAIAFIEGRTVYCRMPECTAWEALDIDYDNTLLDIYELYGGESNVTFSLTLDIIMDLIGKDNSSSDDYLNDAFFSALKVDIYDYSSVQKYKEVSQNELYSDLHSDKGTEFLDAIERTLSFVAEPAEWYIQYYYNAIEKSFMNLAYNALEAGRRDEVASYGEKLYEAFTENNKTSENAEKYFDKLDYQMLFISAAIETAQEMKYVNATKNLVYNVMGRRNLDYLKISADNNDWTDVADRYHNILRVVEIQLENEAIGFFKDKSCWETLIDTDVSTAANISKGAWDSGLNISQMFNERFPLTNLSSDECFKTDRRAMYLSDLQQNVYRVAKNTLQAVQTQLNDPEIYSKYIQAAQLYCRTSIALYENLTAIVNELGNNQDYWTNLFQERIDTIAVSLYQLTMIQKDGINNCLPLDISSFQHSADELSVFETIPSQFTFCSGAGAWRTELNIESDGSFYGDYHDADIGSYGKDYPNGTVYISEFHGKFSCPKKVDEYTYSMSVESFEIDESPDVYYENGTRYITVIAHMWNIGDEILIYLPGAPIDNLPEGFLDGSYIDPSRRELPFGTYYLYVVNDRDRFESELDNSIWDGRYIYLYSFEGRESEINPSYVWPSHLFFCSDNGERLIKLYFEWETNDQREFEATDEYGSGTYYISIDISDDLSTFVVTLTSVDGTDLSAWGGTTDGRFVAEYVRKSIVGSPA